MTKEEWPITSITMTTDALEMESRGNVLFAIGLERVLNAVKQALEEGKPIFIEDKKTGKKYQLMEDSRLIEI